MPDTLAVPFELSEALHGEACQVAVPLINGHLPETRREVDGCKDGGVCWSDVSDAFVDFFNGIFVGVSLGTESPKVLKCSESLAGFRGTAEYL